ncbi:MAG: hypothetical protein EOO42_14430 [Flavobacteriales bacterium]|nr:MAG: hypothetical protein EOO42_14430 [Flavobacteriales bacterium]
MFKFSKILFSSILCSFMSVAYVNAQDLSGIKNQKPISFNGSLEARGFFYNANGIPNRREASSYLISGSPNLTIYGWDIPFYISYGNQGTQFSQPFNQYGLSPTYKWITLHGGYRNVSFSQFTLAGHTMLGGGVEIKPGKLRAGFMYGRLNKATVIDTTTNSLVPYAFNRKGVAAKLGFGSDKNYFDLSFLSAKDDSTSKPIFNRAFENNVAAAKNVALGFNTRFSFLKNFFFESEGALSVYTRDMNSTLSLDSVKNDAFQQLQKILDVNGTTEFYTALTAGIGYRNANYGLKVNYRRIEPDYKTMGAYFFANDVENWTISPSFNSKNRKYRFNGSVGLQRDNIMKQKESTTKRVIGSLNAGADFTKSFSLDLAYSNFSNNQRPSTVKFDQMLKIVQTTHTVSIMPRYTIFGQQSNQVIMLSSNFSRMNDFNDYFDQQAVSRDIKTDQYFLNYVVSFTKIPVSLNGNLSYTTLSSDLMSNDYKGFGFGGSYTFAKTKAQVNMANNIIRGSAQGIKSLTLNSSVNFNYKVAKRQTLKASVFFTNNDPGSAITNVNPSFTETRGELAYQISF